MAQYSNTALQRSLIIVIIILLAAIIALLRWQKNPVFMPFASTVVDSSTEVDKISAAAKSPSASDTATMKQVNFDFYKLLTESSPQQPSVANAIVSPTTTATTAAEATAKAPINSNAMIAHTNPIKPTVKSTSAVIPAQAAESPMSNSAAAGMHNIYYLQVAAVQDQTAAVRFQKQLSTLGYSALVQNFQHQQQLWYRVIVGPYGDTATAALAQQRLQQQRIDSIALMVTTAR